jgi:hypothetical protein
VVKQEECAILGDVELILDKLELARATGGEKVNAIRDTKQTSADPSARPVQVVQIDDELRTVCPAPQRIGYWQAYLCVQAKYDVVSPEARSHLPGK